MVSAVDIAWQDGPCVAQVMAKVGHMVAGKFDEYGDDAYRNKLPQAHVSGQGDLVAVRYELEYINCRRRFSAPYCFAIAQTLDLRTPPTRDSLLDALVTRYQDEATVTRLPVSGFALLTTAHHLAEHDLPFCADAFKAQGYRTHTGYDRDQHRHFLALYPAA